MYPLFSVIIPTCNRPDELEECLRRLAPEKQTLSGDLYEVIVTDDGRRKSAELVVKQEFPWVQWTAGPARGPAANRNHGASLGRGQWLVFVDDDCMPSAALLTAYASTVAKCEADVPTVLEGPTLRMSTPPSLLWEAPHNPSGGARISANFAIRRIDFEASGKFDERYPSAAIEDTEFFCRFHLLGGVTNFVAEAVVHHPLRKLGSPFGMAKKWEGKTILSMDHGAPPLTVLWRLPWHVMRVIQSRFRGQKWSSENIAAAWLFLQEWIIVSCKTPGWVLKWSRRPRSRFWKEQIAKSGSPPRFGF